MQSFNNFLQTRDNPLYLEYFIQRGALPLTRDDDGKYLRQFPPPYHIQALLYRYNVALHDAIGFNRGEEMVRKGWQDTTNVTLVITGGARGKYENEKYPNERYPNMHVFRSAEGGRSKVLFSNVELGIPRLVDKLHNFGFEIASMKQLNNKTISKALVGWRKQIQDSGHVEDYKSYKPMSQSKAMNNYHPGRERSIDRRWAELKDKIVEIATAECSIAIEKMKDPKHAYHLNYSYWEEHFDDLVHSAISYVHRNLKEIDENEDVDREIKKLVGKVIATDTQGGNWGRKTMQAFRTSANQLTDEPWPGQQDHKADNFSNFINSFEKGGTSGKAFAQLFSKMSNRPLDPHTGYLAKGARLPTKKEPRLRVMGKPPARIYNPDAIAASTSRD